MSVRRPPSAPLRRQTEYLLPHDGRLTRFKLMLARFFLRRIGVPHDATDMLRSAMKLGNPTKTEWPAETLPMNSRLFASGFWNYSFFQFNRKFLPPLWAEEQYNPASASFLPRSHNILSMNQTHRNWIGIGFPGRTLEASVDMAGGIMVYPGSYTLEFATLEKGRLVRPQEKSAEVKLALKSSDRIVCSWRGLVVEYTTTEHGIIMKATGNKPLIVSLRPFNVEGPALVYKLHYSEKKKHLTGDADLLFDKSPDHALVSDWKNGDALRRIVPQVRRLSSRKKTTLHAHDARDNIGLTTAAFYFAAADRCSIAVTDHQHDPLPSPLKGKTAREIADEYFGQTIEAELPKDYSDWLSHARNHLIALWDYDSIKPGSYTYHHFWIRDAVIMMYALLLLGAKKAVKPIIERFTGMVRPSGLFQSQTGEWDANGQALWILAQYVRFTHDTSIIVRMRKQITRMVTWIEKASDQHGGVLPPGFSAEHLGPADWYLWDNLWALGGLKAIAPHLKPLGLSERAEKIFSKLSGAMQRYLNHYSYLPAALGRGKDAGMIGSIAAAYPLQLHEFCDNRLLRTLDLIRDNYFFNGCFFQENIHSGLNPYLTLQMAESYLHIGRTRQARQILRSIRRRAQKAYTFPEAIHVRTGGGCMGDGFHGWASAESIIMIRNLMVREVTFSDGTEGLIWLSGYRDKWLKQTSQAQNLCTPWSVTAYRLENLRLNLRGLSTAVTNVLSLPEGFEAANAQNGRPLREIAYERICRTNSAERRYFAIDNAGDSADLVLTPPGRSKQD
ncbi:MAG: hypothetical protein ACOY5B_01585 [Spirochaetota bacterium]